MKRFFLEFKEAKCRVQLEGLKNWKEWVNYCASGNKPNNIPSNPDKTYKKNGWNGWAEWLGTKNKQYNKKYYVNENFFNEWSNDMAYVLGLWWADGCIYGDYNNRFDISLHSDDEYLLEDILTLMESDHKVYRSKNMSSIVIVSKKLCEGVFSRGGIKRKSLHGRFPDVPHEYMPFFIRGLWDGDGTIFMNKKIKKYVSSIMSGNKDFIYQLHNILKENIKDLSGSIHHSITYLAKYDKYYYNRYVLSFGAYDTGRLSSFFQYDRGGTCLLRKKNRFMMSSKPPVFLDYETAKEKWKNLSITTRDEWRERYDEFKNSGIPKYPEIYYKGNWNGWSRWKE
ncbi:MAG: LAGLIDADG family homing endonuclease [Synergistaceae bacterium]